MTADDVASCGTVGAHKSAATVGNQEIFQTDPLIWSDLVKGANFTVPPFHRVFVFSFPIRDHIQVIGYFSTETEDLVRVWRRWIRLIYAGSRKTTLRRELPRSTRAGWYRIVGREDSPIGTMCGSRSSVSMVTSVEENFHLSRCISIHPVIGQRPK